MNTIKISGLHVDARDLGGTYLVTRVAPYNAYVDGERSSTVEGYRYSTVLPERGFEIIDIKVPGARAFEVTAGEYVAVKYDDLEVKLYYDRDGRIQVTARATAVHAVDDGESNKRH